MAFTIYSASAGSGKTYTLVNEYLALTLPDISRFSQVLAITFTNKAAAEMKNRILQALADMREGSDPERLEYLSRRSGLDREQIIIRADELMKAILHRYGDYAVMTIDSFVLRLVRSFAFDLDLPLRFDVELSQTRVTALIIERVIAKAAEGQRIGQILREYIVGKIRFQHSWNYEEELLHTARELFNDQSLEAITGLLTQDDEVILDLERDFNSYQNGFLARVRGICTEICAHVAQRGLDVNDFANKGSGVYGQILSLLKAYHKKDFILKKRLREGEWFKKKDPLKDQHGDFFEQTIEPLRHGLIALIDREIPRYNTVWNIKPTLPSLQLLKEFDGELKRMGREDRMVPIGMFNRKVAEIIREEVIPYIFLRIGDRFSHYLIDEFQDTSTLQWENLVLLVEDVIAEGHHSLVVGDPKQAIYRWRGGDPRIMEEEIENRLPAGQVVHKSLKQNFRSDPVIVAFNNRFFSDFSMDPVMPQMDRFSNASVTQLARNGEGGGYVEIRFFSQEKHEKNTDRLAKGVNWAVDHIQKALRSGLQARDIAILIRVQKEALPLSRALIDAGIPIVTSDSLQLNQSREIRAVISVLQYFSDHDPLHLLELLAFLKGRDFSSFIDTLPQQEAQRLELLDILPEFCRWEQEAAALSLYDLTESVCSALARSCDSPTALLAFLEVVYRESHRLGGDPAAFLDWWQQNENESDTAFANIENPNGIQIMTVHKAKGLEFPMVLLPFCDWEINSRTAARKPSLWVWDRENHLGKGPLPYFIPLVKEDEPTLFPEEIRQEHLANRVDNLNLLYVAFTRAKNALLVAISRNGDDRVSGWIRKRMTLWPEQEDRDCFRLGKPTPIPSTETFNENTLQLSEVHIQPWQQRLVIRRTALEEWLEPHDPLTEGKRLHWLLSNICYESDVSAALQLAVDSGVIAPQTIQQVRTQIETLFSLPVFDTTVRTFFNPPWTIRTEASIISDGAVSRPDRIQFRGNEIMVVDFKREKHHVRHREQLLSYMKLMADSQPGKRIRGLLLYVVSSQAIPIVVRCENEETQ